MQLRVWITGFFLGWFSALLLSGAAGANWHLPALAWPALALLLAGVALAGLDNLPQAATLGPGLAGLGARHLAPAYAAVAANLAGVRERFSPNAAQKPVHAPACAQPSTAEPSESPRPAPAAQVTPAPSARELEALIERLGEGYLANLQELHDAFARVYASRLAAKEAETLELRRQVTALEAELEQLQGQAQQLETERARLAGELQALSGDLRRRLSGLVRSLEQGGGQEAAAPVPKEVGAMPLPPEPTTAARSSSRSSRRRSRA